MRKRDQRGAMGRNTRPREFVADCVGSSGNREISRRISETATCHRAVRLRHLLGFLCICRNSAKTGHTRRGGARYATARISGRSHMILEEIARFLGESQKISHAPARWVCAIYADFSGHFGIRRKRALLGADGEICDRRARGRLRMVFAKSRDSPARPR